MASSWLDSSDSDRPYHIPRVPDFAIFGDAKSSTTHTPHPGGLMTGAASGSRGGSASVNVSGDFSSWRYEGYAEGESPEVLVSAHRLVNRLLWTYTSVLFAQPFEAAKVVLQVRSAEEPAAAVDAEDEDVMGTPTPRGRMGGYDDRSVYQDSDSDGEPEYFTSNITPSMATTPRRTTAAPSSSSTSSRRQRHGGGDAGGSPRSSPKSPRGPPHQLTITNPDSIPEVISQHWRKEGALGTWKAANASFVYKVAASLLENWSRALLAAVLNVPDLMVEEDMVEAFARTAHPWTALGVVAGATVVTGLLLAPLDLVRTKLIVTPSDRPNRGFWANVRSLPSYLCPSALVIPTALHSVIQPVLNVSLPLTLQSQFQVDWRLKPMTFSVAKFCAASAALFVKLPLETVLRRAQVAVLSSRHHLEAAGGASSSLQPVVPPGAYKGVVGTIYHVAAREGYRQQRVGPSRKRKVRGQGIAGLTRGWTVNFVGLVGLWTTGIMSSGVEDDVF